MPTRRPQLLDRSFDRGRGLESYLAWTRPGTSDAIKPSAGNARSSPAWALASSSRVSGASALTSDSALTRISRNLSNHQSCSAHTPDSRTPLAAYFGTMSLGCVSSKHSYLFRDTNNTILAGLPFYLYVRSSHISLHPRHILTSVLPPGRSTRLFCSLLTTGQQILDWLSPVHDGDEPPS